MVARATFNAMTLQTVQQIAAHVKIRNYSTMQNFIEFVEVSVDIVRNSNIMLCLFFFTFPL